jgi:seryl-tRNA synthetase
MPTPPASAAQWSTEDNPYTRAFHRKPVINQITQTEAKSEEPAYSMPRNRNRTTRQSNKLLRARQHASREAVERINGLNRGAKTFLLAAIPTIGDLMEHTKQRHTRITRPIDNFVPTFEVLERARVNIEAQESVRREYSGMESRGAYGNIPRIKPDDSIRLMYENFSSLSVGNAP